MKPVLRFHDVGNLAVGHREDRRFKLLDEHPAPHESEITPLGGRTGVLRIPFGHRCKIGPGSHAVEDPLQLCACCRLRPFVRLRRNADFRELAFLGHAGKTVLICAVEILHLEPPDSRVPQMLLLEFLGEEVFAKVVPKFPFDAGERHSVHLFKAGFGSVLLHALLDDSVHLLLDFIVGDGDAVFNGLCDDELFVYHGLQHLCAQTGRCGIDLVVQRVELHLGVQLRFKDQFVVDCRHNPVERLRLDADRV